MALVDRLVHNAEIIAIDGDSYRRKEGEERQKQRRASPPAAREGVPAIRQGRPAGPRSVRRGVAVEYLHPWDRRVQAEGLRSWPLGTRWSSAASWARWERRGS